MSVGIDLSQSLGMELAGKRALKILYDGLNTAIEQIHADWDVLDDAMGFARVTPELIETRWRSDSPFGNFYHGHRPSLINAGSERYPNCSVMVYQSVPKNEGLDHEDVFTQTMFVELMAKSEDSEEEVNSRIQRMTDAVHAVIIGDPTLGGGTQAVGDTPNVTIEPVFAVLDDKARGPRFLYQGSRMEYMFQKYVPR